MIGKIIVGILSELRLPIVSQLKIIDLVTGDSMQSRSRLPFRNGDDALVTLKYTQ